MSRKIIENLYLGDMHSAPDDTELTISCAHEIFIDQNPLDGQQKIVNEQENKIYYDFVDFPNKGEINEDLLEDAIQQIEKNIKKKKIYVHCIWGINRSASIVFMFMVRNNYLSNENYQKAFIQFKQIYPIFNPNPGWKEIVQKLFPFNNK